MHTETEIYIFLQNPHDAALIKWKIGDIVFVGCIASCIAQIVNLIDATVDINSIHQMQKAKLTQFFI